jgi:predicted transposase/invertase (TIGR01784 family)
VLSYNEAKAVTDTAFADGKSEGKIEVAKTMLAKGFDAEMVAEITGLPLKEVKAL